MGLFGRRRERRLIDLERARLARRMANEDVTLLGEELTQLHFETLNSELRGETVHDYLRALDAYEQAKQHLRQTEGLDLIRALQPILEEGRYHLTCVLARRDGRPLPERLPSCFFNPQHGPSHSEIDWAPPGGVERRVAVCLTDRNRLDQSKLPAVRMVRVGEQLVPWFEADRAFGLLDGKIDVRRLANLRAYHHGQSALYGADPVRHRIGDIGGGGGQP
jgi:hypothetical protein